MIKDKKVKVNKQKPSNACPARLMLITIKCPLILRQAALAAIPMLPAVIVLGFCQFSVFPNFSFVDILFVKVE